LGLANNFLQACFGTGYRLADKDCLAANIQASDLLQCSILHTALGYKLGACYPDQDDHCSISPDPWGYVKAVKCNLVAGAFADVAGAVPTAW